MNHQVVPKSSQSINDLGYCRCSRHWRHKMFEKKKVFSQEALPSLFAPWDGSHGGNIAGLISWSIPFLEPEPQNNRKIRKYHWYVFLFSDSSHLYFFICPYIVGSLTSKLPSIFYSQWFSYPKKRVDAIWTPEVCTFRIHLACSKRRCAILSCRTWGAFFYLGSWGSCTPTAGCFLSWKIHEQIEWMSMMSWGLP